MQNGFKRLILLILLSFLLIMPSISFSANKSTAEAVSLPKKLINTAKSYLGTRYMYGGASPAGFDCTGFVYYIFGRCGVNIPRTVEEQLAAGKKISRKDLKPGDIVFFANTYKYGLSHAGMYIGNNKFIHAERWGYGVRIDSLGNNYYASRYYSACRPRKLWKHYEAK